MKFKSLVALAAVLLLMSCEKITNVEVVDPLKTGSFRYQLLDDFGKGVANIKVHAYRAKKNEDSYYLPDDAYSDTLRTDAEGAVVFSALKAGNYVLKAAGISLNKVHYNTTEYMQVVAGHEKSRATKISDFSGRVKIRLITQMVPELTLPDFGIALVDKYPMDTSQEGLRKVIDEAVIKGMTDANGQASFTIPSDVSYYLLIFRPDKSRIQFLSDVYTLDKGGLDDRTVHAGDY